MSGDKIIQGLNEALAFAAGDESMARVHTVLICSHAKLRFNSGDYYLTCDVCGARWAMMKEGQAEYGQIAGKKIGASPESSNQIWPPGSDPVRVRKPQGDK